MSESMWLLVGGGHSVRGGTHRLTGWLLGAMVLVVTGGFGGLSGPKPVPFSPS